MLSIVVTVPDNRIISEALVHKTSFVMLKTWRWPMTTSFPPPVAHSAEGHYAQKLLNDLMENYSSALRPVEDTDRALNVTLQITLSQIKDMVGTSSSARSLKSWIVKMVRHGKISMIKTNHAASDQTTGLYTTTTLSLLNLFCFSFNWKISKIIP